MNALTTPSKTSNAVSPLLDPAKLDQMIRVGKMLANSILFPEHLRKGTPDQAIANGALVVNMAIRLNEDPLTVAQNIYFIGGKPSWGTSYMIAKANQHGVFKNPIDWEIKGKGDDLVVTAKAELAGTSKPVSVTLSMETAKAENWTKNPKYKSIPEQMLRYRTAAFLIRLYCPEIMVGVPAQVEIESGDMKDVTPHEYAEQFSAATEASFEEVDTVEVKQGGEKDAHEAKDEKPVDSSQFEALKSLITNELTDATDVDDVLDMYGDQISQMRENAPEVFNDFQLEVAEFRKAAAE